MPVRQWTSWSPLDLEIVDIGGSRIHDQFDNKLPQAFQGEADFPKEIAYTEGMENWNVIADSSYQTTDELAIINRTAHEVVSHLPSGTHIVDLGAANSMKFAPYLRAFLEQGKSCTYVPLDLTKASLVEQIDRAKATFPNVRCIGLWGSFEDGNGYFAAIPGGRLFLSLGSIFYNAPGEMCRQRCKEFVAHLGFNDRLVVGQDSPSVEGAASHTAYQTKAYKAFMIGYLTGIQKIARIKADATKAWTFTSRMDDSMHYFMLIAQEEMTCEAFENLKVAKGTTFKIFKSWKRSEAEIREITEQQGLVIRTIGQAPTSGMKQYLIQKK